MKISFDYIFRKSVILDSGKGKKSADKITPRSVIYDSINKLA